MCSEYINLSGNEREKKAIGAFCTDIQESVNRIDEYGDKAFKHHAAYIEKVAEAYGRQLKIHERNNSSLETLGRNSSFWIPGDALWGVVFADQDKMSHESMVAAFARVLNACAYGLVEAHRKALELKVKDLHIRGAMMGGQVLVKELTELNSFLYNGNSLNACGRLQNDASQDSIILGFVIPVDESETNSLVNQNIDAPEISFGELSGYLEDLVFNYPELRECKPGCKITIDIVERSSDKHKFMRFFSKYHKIRGLHRCKVITTDVSLTIDEHRRGTRVIDNPIGPWKRSTVTLKKEHAILSLTDLVKLAKEYDFTLPNAYKDNNVTIELPQSAQQNFKWYFKGSQHHPWAGGGGIRWEKVGTVDFDKYKFCLLPLHRGGKDAFLLVRTNVKGEKRSLILHQIHGQLVPVHTDLSNFVDAAGSCVEFIFE